MALNKLLDPRQLCDPNIAMSIANLTSPYIHWTYEPSTVASTVIIFVLAGLFFSLSLFSSVSDASAILNPKVRLFLSSALSLFLPVMSYLFSEAKNVWRKTTISSTSAGASMGDFPHTASMGDFTYTPGLILVWMLLVELLRNKVDEIRMRGYSSTIQRAGRVVWLGSLVFFNIKSTGRKAVFSVLWVLCAIEMAQRIAFTEVEKRSYAHGKNPSVLTSYMAQMLERGEHRQNVRDGNEVLKRCKYIVMGEKKLVKKATEDGYEFNDITRDDGIITVGKVWELPETGSQHLEIKCLKRICLSFALFKLLRRRFEHMPAMTDEEACNCRKVLLNGFNGQSKPADALFQVMNDEVNFLSEYYHSAIPVIFASPFFLLANYFLFPIVVTVLCLMSIILCGNGDVAYAFSSLIKDNTALHYGVSKIVKCLLAEAIHNNAIAFFFLVDLSITAFLFIVFFYEEIWEFVVFLLSNWFMVSVLCNYRAKSYWPQSPTFGGAFRCLLWLRSKMSRADLRVKQFSVLNLLWPLHLPLLSPLSLAIRTESVPSSLKQSIMDCLVEHDGHPNIPLTKGTFALDKHNISHEPLREACTGHSVAEVILTLHIATSILEFKCAPPSNKNDVSAASRRVAIKLSNYCAYLVAVHPELLTDNKEKAEDVFEAMKKEMKDTLGCRVYFLSSKSARVEKLMAAAIESNKKQENTAMMKRDDIEVETTTSGHSDQQGSSKITTEAARAEAGQQQSDGSSSKVVVNGAKLGKFLVDEADPGTVWKVLADVWTELIVYAAPSNDEERVKGHEEVLVQGGEFITVLWALTTHIGVTRPPTTKQPTPEA